MSLLRKHAGFTLIEALLVLTIVSFFVSLPTVAMKEASRTLTTIYFFDSLEKSILTCQQTAIIANKGADVMQDYNNRRTLAFQLETGEWLAHLTVPDTLTIGDMKGKIAFSGGTGNAKGDQKIIFTWPEKNQKIVYNFLFGKGHYEKIITTLS